ncbi:hypothetical protein RR46_14792 [Papilio xuthus]|uniref:Uncharacterized protein n=1 Tax=Papilio xuthus TaxID=66420 RepID=A0A194PE35_PAPXU|nr:hypothetical protein RR46_14792 [Papilio xuthus]
MNPDLQNQINTVVECTLAFLSVYTNTTNVPTPASSAALYVLEGDTELAWFGRVQFAIRRDQCRLNILNNAPRTGQVDGSGFVCNRAGIEGPFRPHADRVNVYFDIYCAGEVNSGGRSTLRAHTRAAHTRIHPTGTHTNIVLPFRN